MDKEVCYRTVVRTSPDGKALSCNEEAKMMHADGVPGYDVSSDEHADAVARYQASLREDPTFRERVRRVRDAVEAGSKPENLIPAEVLREWLNDAQSGRAVRP